MINSIEEKQTDEVNAGHQMEAEHEAHLCRILDAVDRDLSVKYRKGQAEHGGRLWLKPGLLDMAIDEALDQVIYLRTLKEQIGTTRLVRWPDGVPGTEVSVPFLQGMANRMATSFAKYGAVRDAYPKKVDAVASLLMRLIRYLGVERFEAAVDTAKKHALALSVVHRREHGNTEYLMDVANFAMIEFMYPGNPNAHFVAEDSAASPGRAWATGHVGQDANTHGREQTRSGGLYKRDGD